LWVPPIDNVGGPQTRTGLINSGEQKIRRSAMKTLAVTAMMMVMGAGLASAQSVPTTEADQIQALASGAKRKGDETG
jgi:hypothetical protein